MRFAAKSAALIAATISLCSVAHAAPLISAFIGTQTATTKTAYFVLDFNDPGPNPETYAFGWYYEPTKKAADFPVALAQSLTGVNGFQEQHQDFSFGRFYTLFGYNGRTKFNDFAGNNSGDPNGSWGLWLGFDGTNWTNSNFGASDITLSDTPTFSGSNLTTASWTGWRWLTGSTGEISAAPRTPQVVVVPEAGTPELFAVGLAGMTLFLNRRIRSRRA